VKFIFVTAKTETNMSCCGKTQHKKSNSNLNKGVMVFYITIRDSLVLNFSVSYVD